MKQTNEHRISKLEKEVDELKSIILNLQQQLLNTNQSQKTDKKVEEFCQKPNIKTSKKEHKNNDYDDVVIQNRFNSLNPLMQQLVLKYNEKKRNGDID